MKPAPPVQAPRRSGWRYNARELATRPDLVPTFRDAPAPVWSDDDSEDML